MRRHEDPLAIRVRRVGCVERALARMPGCAPYPLALVLSLGDDEQAPQAPLCETLRFPGGNRHVSPLSRALRLGLTRLVRRPPGSEAR